MLDKLNILVLDSHINHPDYELLIILNAERMPKFANWQWVHQIQSLDMFCLFEKLTQYLKQCFNWRARYLPHLFEDLKIFGGNMRWHSHTAVIDWNWIVTSFWGCSVMVPMTTFWILDRQDACQFCLSPCTVFSHWR